MACLGMQTLQLRSLLLGCHVAIQPAERDQPVEAAALCCQMREQQQLLSQRAAQVVIAESPQASPASAGLPVHNCMVSNNTD